MTVDARHTINRTPRHDKGSCLIDWIPPLGPVTTSCHHGHVWFEGASWDPAENLNPACRPCTERRCELRPQQWIVTSATGWTQDVIDMHQEWADNHAHTVNALDNGFTK